MKKMELHLLTNRNTILLICLAALFGTGCLKPSAEVDHNVLWKGKVLEKVTKKAVPNAKINLYERKVDLLGSSVGILIETYYSDKDGNFSFKYTERVNYGYTVKVFADKYYESEDYIPSEKKGVASTTELLLDPYAWIKFHVKNINPYDEYDKILVNNLKPVVGSKVDTFLVEESIGNTKFYISTWYYKNKIKTVLLDSIANLIPHDTMYYEIKY